MQVTVVGVGYVGLVAGVCVAHAGHSVTCVDIDPERVEALRAGKSPIHEPGIEELIVEGLSSGDLKFATPDRGWADLVSEVTMVAVGTPMSANGSADLSQVREVVSELCASAKRPFTMVMKSTVPVGTGLELQSRYLSRAPWPIAYVSNPEFLREGKAIEDWHRTDRIVLGATHSSDFAPLRELYADIEAPVLETDITSAETVKYASNAFLSTKISFINEIANLCDAVGADIDHVAQGVGLDARISPHFLSAGIGYGGSCFPKDTRALEYIAAINGYQFSLLKSVIDVNNRQRLLPVIQLVRALPDIDTRTVAVLGLSFKPHTDDARESPAMDIIAVLRETGATVTAYDPVARCDCGTQARRFNSALDAMRGASAAIIATDWPEFAEMDWSEARGVMEGPGVIFDGRNCLDRRSVESAGLVYMAIGRPGAHRA